MIKLSEKKQIPVYEIEVGRDLPVSQQFKDEIGSDVLKKGIFKTKLRSVMQWVTSVPWNKLLNTVLVDEDEEIEALETIEAEPVVEETTEEAEKKIEKVEETIKEEVVEKVTEPEAVEEVKVVEEDRTICFMDETLEIIENVKFDIYKLIDDTTKKFDKSIKDMDKFVKSRVKTLEKGFDSIKNEVTTLQGNLQTIYDKVAIVEHAIAEKPKSIVEEVVEDAIAESTVSLKEVAEEVEEINDIDEELLEKVKEISEAPPEEK